MILSSKERRKEVIEAEVQFMASQVIDRFIHQLLLCSFSDYIYKSYFDKFGKQLVEEALRKRTKTIFRVVPENPDINNGVLDIILEASYYKRSVFLTTKTKTGLVTGNIHFSLPVFLTEGSRRENSKEDFKYLKIANESSNYLYGSGEWFVANLRECLTSLFKEHRESLCKIQPLKLE